MAIFFEKPRRVKKIYNVILSNTCVNKHVCILEMMVHNNNITTWEVIPTKKGNHHLTVAVQFCCSSCAKLYINEKWLFFFLLIIVPNKKDDNPKCSFSKSLSYRIWLIFSTKDSISKEDEGNFSFIF